MPAMTMDKDPNGLALFLIAIAAISGGMGAAAIASHHLLRGRAMTISYAIAYVFIGAAMGVLSYAYGHWFGVISVTMLELVGSSLLAGAIGSLTLASANISARFLLKKLGIEVEIKVKHKEES